MIVDTSAVVAILLKEKDGDAFLMALIASESRRMSAASYVELVNVLDRRVGEKAVEIADAFLEEALVDIVPFTVEQAKWARHGRLTYGIGRKGGSLNFGDCFSYALAKATGEPLLFKGADFALTDVTPAIPVP